MATEFTIGDKAVYPSQGVAEVIGIEKKEVYGKVQRFYVLRGIDTGLRILVPSTRRIRSACAAWPAAKRSTR